MVYVPCFEGSKGQELWYRACLWEPSSRGRRHERHVVRASKHAMFGGATNASMIVLWRGGRANLGAEGVPILARRACQSWRGGRANQLEPRRELANFMTVPVDT